MQKYMSRKLKAVLLLTCIFLTFDSLAQHKSTVRSAVPVRTGIYDPAIDIKLESLLRKMTLEEKGGTAGSILSWPANWPGHRAHRLQRHDRQGADRGVVQYFDRQRKQCLPTHRA